MINKSLIFLTLLLCIGWSQLYAAQYFSNENIKNVHFNFGSWQENYQQVQGNRSGDLKGFEIKPYLSLGLDYSLKAKHFLILESGYVLRSDYSEKSVTKDLLFARVDYAYQLSKGFNIRLGSSFIWTTLSGDGSEVQLRNGNSTQTYYAPSERKNIFNQTLDFGIEYRVKKLSARLHQYIYSLDDQKQRLSSFSISLNYLFPLKDL